MLMATYSESKLETPLAEEENKVCAWLNELGINRSSDDEAMSCQSVSAMSTMMRTNRQADRDRMLAVKDLENRTKEYESEIKRLDNILMPLMSTPDQLPESILESSRVLAQLNVALDLNNPNESHYEMEMTNLAKKVQDAERQVKRMESDVFCWTKKNTALMASINNHQRILDILENNIASESKILSSNETELEFLSSKENVYHENIEKLERALTAVGMNSLLTHESLMKDFKRLEAVQKEATELKRKLDGYRQLPADIPRANIIIIEAKSRLQKLNDELDGLMDEFSKTL